MALQYSTPGVYIEELDAFPHSIVAVPTAIPAFIGYTQFAVDDNKQPLKPGTPMLIQSQSDYERYFGTGYISLYTGGQFKIDPSLFMTSANAAAAGGNAPAVAAPAPAGGASAPAPAGGAPAPAPAGGAPAPAPVPAPAPAGPVQDLTDLSTFCRFYLYDSIRLFYANGGGQCYIISVGSYSDGQKNFTGKTSWSGDLVKPLKPADSSTTDPLIGVLYKIPDVTLIVIPDAAAMTDSKDVYQQVLLHCNDTQSRMGIFDINNPKNGYTNTINTLINGDGGQISGFRTDIGDNFKNYGTAYFPWLNASVVQSNEVDFTNFTPNYDIKAASQPFITLFANASDPKDQVGNIVANFNNSLLQALSPKMSALNAALNGSVANTIQSTLNAVISDPYYTNTISKIPGVATAQTNATVKGATQAAQTTFYNIVAPIVNTSMTASSTACHLALMASSSNYSNTIQAIVKFMNLLPPSGAIAGIYTLVDNSRGVWKAPANVSLNSVNSPSVELDKIMTDNLNIDPISGKSINAIRTFRGIGTLVYGGRTLDGNSDDWRYINVRRTLIMMEQSIKLALVAYVFEPNDDTTWITVISMISNFLTNLWKQGALAGAKPEDAFQVMCGLNVTMTSDDILNGYMRVNVKVAVVHPAEFIVLTFQQELQTS